ncbi:hypothetical protein ANANG_G00266490 [Anguilla anguilla]|uniref:Uncharacterized protein n=1 Tax=Anguilla anguilla TaxID=7936 RepID=A0A9D3LPS7_ANGAN|nr:hypothetical protein ANANG_G00266490 [Anguilla anguilla]
MGPRLSRRSSLDNEIKIPKNGRQRGGSCGEAGGSGSCVGGDFVFTSLILNSDKLPDILRKSRPNPYVRRVAWVREIQKLLREHKVEQACDVLKLLRKDLGLEGTSLNDVLHRNASFLNLVDPISHELLLTLARDLQCPKPDSDRLKSSSKICRQLVYHLSPHSKWLQQGKAGQGGAGQGAWQGMPKRKAQVCVKTALQQKLAGDTLDLSSLPLSGRDLHRVARYLHGNGEGVAALDLSFTGLRDEQLGRSCPPWRPSRPGRHRPQRQPADRGRSPAARRRAQGPRPLPPPGLGGPGQQRGRLHPAPAPPPRPAPPPGPAERPDHHLRAGRSRGRSKGSPAHHQSIIGGLRHFLSVLANGERLQPDQAASAGQWVF